MKILKKITVGLIIASMMLSSVGCGNKQVKEAEWVTIVDTNGDEVTIPTEIDKVICRSGNGTSFMVAMGYGDRLAGTADYVVTNPWADVFYEGISDLPTFGWSPSSEEVYAVEADLVMLADPEVAGNLREDGISAICYKQYNEKEILDSVRVLGELFGEDAETYGEKWIEYYNNKDAIIEEALKDVKDEDKLVVYNIYGQSYKGVGRTSGGGSIDQFWVEEAGGIFSTADLPNDGPKITEEEAIKRNPDVIFIGGIYSSVLEAEILSSPEWSEVPAVKEGRIYNIPIGFTGWDFYGVEFPLLKLWAAQQMYPECFDIDMHAVTKDFYKEFYNIEFADEQIDYILKGLSPDGTEFITE